MSDVPPVSHLRGVELRALFAAAQSAAPPDRAAAFQNFSKGIVAAAWDYPPLTPIELRVGVARNKAERLAMQALLPELFAEVQADVLREVSSSDRARVYAGLQILEAFATHARPATPALARLMLTVDENYVEHFGSTLQKVGGLEHDFVPIIVAALAKGGAAVRERAMAALSAAAWRGSAAFLVPAVGALAHALGGPDESLRDKAAWLLAELGPAAAPARNALREVARADTRPAGMWAAVALHAIDPHDPSAVPGLITLLGSPSELDGTRSAAHRLARIGPPAKAAIPKLAELARRGDPAERGTRLEALVAIDTQGAMAVPVLIEAAGNSELAWSAVDALVRYAPRAPAARAWLSESVRSVPGAEAAVETFCRAPQDAAAEFGVFLALFEAAPSAVSFKQALTHMGYDCRRGLPLLLRALDSREHDVVAWAVHALPLFGIEAASALPRLRELLKHDRPEMRAAVARQIIRVDPDGSSSIDDLIALLDDDEHPVRVEAAQVLGRLGLRAARAAPALARSRFPDDEFFREQSRIALGQVGGDRREMVAEVVSQLLTTGRPYWASRVLRRVEIPPLPPVEDLIATVEREHASAETAHALLLLARHGESARGALPVLRAALKSPQLNIRSAAVDVIAAIGPAARDAVPDLCAQLDALSATDRDDPEGRDQWLLDRIVNALGAIGPAAREAIPHIVLACEVPKRGREEMDMGAVQALERIEPPRRPRLFVKVDPGLSVCTGMWRDVGADMHAAFPVPIRTEVGREPDGSGTIVVSDGADEATGYQTVVIFVKRGPDGALDVTANHITSSMDTAARQSVVESGTITFRSASFGKGAPVIGLLEMQGRFGFHAAVAFKCDDPFGPATRR